MSSDSRWEEFYLGSRRFLFVSDLTGLPIDQINFMIGQLSALTFAYLFRVYMHSSFTSSNHRHLAALAAGTSISYFCFGKQILLALILVCLCYGLLLILPASIVHHVTLCAAMTFVSAVHIQRQFYEDGVYVVDITGPLMIMVQKVTSLAYSVYDGDVTHENDLTTLQKKLRVTKKPTALEYFSYVLCFQSILAGPLFMFTDYKDFIEGTQYIKYAAKQKKEMMDQSLNNNELNGVGPKVSCPSQDPNPTSVAVQKVGISFVCALAVAFFRPLFPISRVSEPSFLGASVWYRLFYIVALTAGARQLYYTAWYLGEGICTMSGLGFNGYDAQGQAQWDLITPVSIMGVEFGTSFKSTLEAWNMSTMLWLRFVVYERAPFQPTLLTYTVSSIWHGFYPGYYLTFFSGAFFTLAARAVRRILRPMVLPWGDTVKKGYDFITFLTTRLVLSYATFPFVLLRFWDSVNLYLSLWCYLHILGLLTLLILPSLTPYTKRWIATKKVD